MELIRIVSDILDEEADQQKFCRPIRKKYRLLSNGTIWINSLSGEDAYRIAELTERCSKNWSMLRDICLLMDIDQDRLVSTVKSMNRWERSGDREVCPSCFLSDSVQERLLLFISKNREDKSYYQSTGRKKAWCE